MRFFDLEPTSFSSYKRLLKRLLRFYEINVIIKNRNQGHTFCNTVREIGVLRATGSSRQEIRRLIVTEGVLVTAVGGGLGLLIGTALGVFETLAIAESAEGMTAHIPYLALLGIFAATLAVGLLASVRPASRAASVPPVKALSVE